MVNRLERFFNWQSDMDWTWGPFLPLRPPRDVPMRPWVWVRLFAALTLIGCLLIALGGLVCVVGPRLAVRQHWAMPPGLTETLAALTAMGADLELRLLLIGVVLSLPLLFFAACFPFHAAWNRRAARLAAHAARPETSAEQAGIWPPAPL
jgi:hypothetical protein